MGDLILGYTQDTRSPVGFPSEDELHERIMEKERLNKKRVGAAAPGANDDATGQGLGQGPGLSGYPPVSSNIACWKMDHRY